MKAIEKHYVTFLSPGTLFPEATRKPIDSWDTRIAARMAREVKERYNATPYGFRFVTNLEMPPIEASGVEFDVRPKQVRKSGVYFLTGVIRTAAEVLAGTDPSEDILRDNVRINGFKAVVENRNSWWITLPFEENDTLLDADGNVIAKGTDYQ